MAPVRICTIQRLAGPAAILAMAAGLMASASAAGLMASASAAPLRGLDLSFTPQMEAAGAEFHDAGKPRDLLALVADHGVNLVRLRLWHHPADGHSGLAEVLAMARRAEAAGLDILLDFHFSDTWADPGKQTLPVAWQGLPFAALVDSVHARSRSVFRAFEQQGTVPAMVQFGNEITPGMLWDHGRVSGAFDNERQWRQLAMLLTAAMAGMDKALADSPRPEVMIHIDRGGDNQGARWFLDRLAATGVPYDLIGLSYYPWWHGTLDDLETNLRDLALRYGKELVVVETAYPWTLRWFDHTHNLVGLPEHLLPGYPATPDGQRDFLATVTGIVDAVPKGLGRGVCWWAPEWIAHPGVETSWENLTLFDDQGRALPALSAFAPASHHPGRPDHNN